MYQITEDQTCPLSFYQNIEGLFINLYLDLRLGVTRFTTYLNTF